MPDQVRKGLAFCIPLSGKAIPPEWAFALRFLDAPINMYGVYYAPKGLAVDEARCASVEFARKQNCKYMMFIDEDTVVPPETVRKFVYYMENNDGIQVIGGVYCSKCLPPAPLVFRGNGAGSYWDWKVGEFFWVTGLGMGCTMIRMSVFDKIDQELGENARPYFLTVKADGHIDAIARNEAWTEDLYFCEKVLKAYGWRDSAMALEDKLPEDKPIWCDGATLCDHIDSNTGTIYQLPPNSKPTVRRMAAGDKKILDLGCGGHATPMKDGTPVRFDMKDDVKADYRGDVRVLPFKTESFDVVYSSHTLEHFEQKQIGAVLDEWLRVLAPGGELRLVVPDLTVAARMILDNGVEADAWKVLYGEQTDKWDFHKTGFTPQSLEGLLKEKGLEIIRIWQEPPFNLFAEARKIAPSLQIGSGQGRAILRADVTEAIAQNEGAVSPYPTSPSALLVEAVQQVNPITLVSQKE